MMAPTTIVMTQVLMRDDYTCFMSGIVDKRAGCIRRIAAEKTGTLDIAPIFTSPLFLDPTHDPKVSVSSRWVVDLPVLTLFGQDFPRSSRRKLSCRAQLLVSAVLSHVRSNHVRRGGPGAHPAQLLAARAQCAPCVSAVQVDTDRY